MTDDDRLAALFRDAAASSELPPPAFDHDRVVATSRRVTARRRSAVLGAAMAVLVVAGVSVAVALPSDDTTSTAAAPAAAPEAAAPDAAPEVLAEPVEPFRAPDDDRSLQAEPVPDAATAPEALREVAPFTGTPLGPSPLECAPRQDPELRAYVEQVLPEVVGAPEAAVTMECRPGGERGVSLEVDDAGAAGLLTVQYLPPGATVDAQGGAQAPTASGGTVVVSSRGAGPAAAVPFEGRLDTAAAFLAPRL